MLTKEENELITRVGPGTPMGDLMRQYWLPSMMSSELPAPDCPPVRIRLLCENLIAFRTSSGQEHVLQRTGTYGQALRAKERFSRELQQLGVAGFCRRYGAASP